MHYINVASQEIFIPALRKVFVNYSVKGYSFQRKVMMLYFSKGRGRVWEGYGKGMEWVGEG